ncbi:MAG: knotted carbamoyltransferase YgeW [Candidatus Thermoplasmatota archaeon]|nr:knotted carbamoyltransferase YgeW [Candidatus Thermoplasmatota archaeon]MDP7265034.1 knotted carbamoyltransferase YgeW [Candidatus Thermoplasmatota archaeon]
MSNDEIQKMIKELGELDIDMYNKDFLQTWEHPMEDIKAVLLVSLALEEMYRANISCRVFDGSLAVSNFRDKSTRTRFSFASAASLLGLDVQDIDESKSQVSHGETVRETANMISFLTEVIGIRDDLFLGEGHKYQKEVADSIDAGFKEGVLVQRPGVINLQCDRDHPTQSMADLLHLIRTYGSLESLKGKKIAMTWAYSPAYGKPMSVPQGIIGLMSRLGMDVVLAHPEGYDLIPEIVDIAGKNAEKYGGSFTIVESMEEAFRDADIVYPKSWAPVTVMEKRTALLHQGKAGAAGMEVLEQECIKNNSRYKNWECTEELMSLTKDGKALYMHCLPADITDVNCTEGEVADSVFERYRLPTYHEAEHKLYAIAAMMLLTRFPDVSTLLTNVLDRGEKRRFE